MNHRPSLIDFFLRNYLKTRNYHQKKGCGRKRKTTAFVANGCPTKY